jgi:hypothetical protein
MSDNLRPVEHDPFVPSKGATKGYAGADHTPDLSVLFNMGLIPLSVLLSAPYSPTTRRAFCRKWTMILAEPRKCMLDL